MQVRTTGGLVSGREHGGIWRFASIPFAAPPVGPLRFAPPAPVEPWIGVRDASAFGPLAPQSLGTLDEVLQGGRAEQSEDCLTLSVWTAATDACAPVMVWIHGGAFTTGGGSVPWYRGDRFAADGVVLVTINYRLGALGWAHWSEPEEPAAGNGNLGSLDQIAALRWVRDNIAAFGGDASNVTVFGESAGGTSVAALLAMSEANDLFHKAIIQSASFTQLRSAERAGDLTRSLLAHCGLDSVDAMRDADLETLLAAQNMVLAETALTGLDAFGPTFGTDLLPADPRAALRHGQAGGRPLLIGTNRDEMHLFSLLDPGHLQTDRAKVVHSATRLVGDAAEELVATYEAAKPTLSPPQLASQIATDAAFRRDAQRAAAGHAGPVFQYEFHWATPAFGGVLGACHALEVPFVFDNLDVAGVAMFTGDGPERVGLAQRIHQAWVSFAATGVPRTGSVDWPRFDLERRSTYIFDTDDSVIDDPDRSLRQLWDRLVP